MKAAIYVRASSQIQTKAQIQQDVELLNENGYVLMSCNRCGWAGMPSTPSKWVSYPRGEIRERKRYPKQKCPFCN